eukprot:6491311-Amphidinium_carterae.1
MQPCKHRLELSKCDARAVTRSWRGAKLAAATRLQQGTCLLPGAVGGWNEWKAAEAAPRTETCTSEYCTHHVAVKLQGAQQPGLWVPWQACGVPANGLRLQDAALRLPLCDAGVGLVCAVPCALAKPTSARQADNRGLPSGFDAHSEVC